MILLLDQMSKEAEMLCQSLRETRASFQTFCFEDDGFLPEGVTSPYHYYLRMSDSEILGRPRYFSRLQVPAGWEIRSSGVDGNVWDYETKRAEITYAEPKSRRFIQKVTWLDEKGIACWTDHYDRNGYLYARTTRNAEGREILKVYYAECPDGRRYPCIMEDLHTHCITLRKKNGTGIEEYIFSGKVDFMAFFLREIGAECDRIFFNSLNWSFFTERKLRADEEKTDKKASWKKSGDILFWQEEIYGRLPGNMVTILNEQRWVDRIIVQSESVYQKILEQLRDHAVENGVQNPAADAVQFKALGYIYSFTRENERKSEVLILTNSDAVEKLPELVENLPEFTFRIGAFTEMSQKLMGMGEYENVMLYPSISERRAKELLHECDFYLDINHANEIADAVHEAYLNRSVILGFKETAHNRLYEPEEHLFAAEEWQQMAEQLKCAAASKEEMQKLLQRQDAKAMRVDRTRYIEVLNLEVM